MTPATTDLVRDAQRTAEMLDGLPNVSAEAMEHGAVSRPVSHAALSAQGLADALYMARLAVGMDRVERC